VWGNNLVLCTFVACIIVGFYAEWCARRLHMPAMLFQTTGAITMIPGVLAYQAMLGALGLAGVSMTNMNDPLAHFTQNFAMTAFVLGAISVGITTPSLLFNRAKPVV
jgi:uncharacterized membrane protein YjjB (DUF3815 family)